MAVQFLSVFLLATLASVPLLLFTRWLRGRAEPGNALRFQRILFAGIVLSTLCAPLLHALWTVPWFMAGTSIEPVAAAVESLRFDLLQPVVSQGVDDIRVHDLMLALWLAGASLVIAMLVNGQRHFRRLAVHGEPVNRDLLPVTVPPGVRVLRSAACRSPFVCGVLHPAIVLPVELVDDNGHPSCDEQLAAVLLHELAHFENRDTTWLPMCRALLALAWPVLPLWLFYGDIVLQAELAADSRALRGAGYAERRRYARNLVNAMQQQFESAPGMPAFALRQPGRIHMRIRNILDNTSTVSSSARRKLARGTALLLIVPLAGVQAVMASDAEDMAFIAPLVNGTLTSTFGERHNPFTGEMAHHNGVDIKAPLGTPVLAPAHGEVIFAGEKNDKYGIVVEIQHQDGFRTVYAHLQSTGVTVGDVVTEGIEIGRVGVSGQTTGPHVHVEVYAREKRVDPMKYLPLARLSSR